MQMDFFKGEVVSFPAARQAVLVRDIAERLYHLERTDAESADNLWVDTCLKLQAEKSRLGLSAESVRAELDRFALAVHAEMRRIAWAKEAQSHA